jgi:anti-sigma factor RsiW
MTSQHLSDEAVAAFADGVLGGLARERAARHVDGCAECRAAVRVQREAALALRAAAPPQAPAELFDRLRALPLTTELPTLPTAIAPDGSTVLATFTPMAALVPVEHERSFRFRPYVATAAALTLAGALAAGSVAQPTDTPQNGTGHFVRQVDRTRAAVAPNSVDPVHVWRGFAP